MKERRWLLPFTHGIDAEALDLLCQMAQEVDATLVAVSLHVPEPGTGMQLVQIQESNVFLKFVDSLARVHQVTVECHEVWVAIGDNIPSRIQTFVRDYQCSSVVIIVKQRRGDNHPQCLAAVGTRTGASPVPTAPVHDLVSASVPYQVQTDVIATLIQNPPASLVLLRVPEKQKRNRTTSFLQHIFARLFPVPVEDGKEVSIRHKSTCGS